MDKEFRILIIEASRYRVLLEYCIEGLQGKTAMQGENLANYIQRRLNETDEEIKKIKTQ
jgi:hypothetical protein